MHRAWFLVYLTAAALPAQLTGLFATGPDRTGLYYARDFNPDPKTVEVVLVAYEWPAQLKTGVTTWCKTFNGVVPGPAIVANKGDKVIVHFFNFLSEGSSIHWHGVDVPAVMDGSNISQNAVPPHGGYYRYEFTVLKAQLAWYHPHFNTAVQVEQGMYGPLIFKDPQEDQRLGLPTREVTLLFDDALLYLDGSHAALYPQDPARRAERQLNGREGNVLLVNGRDTLALDVYQGVPERWRIVNVSSSRLLRFSISGHAVYRIGGDGGLITSPVLVQPVDLVPWPVRPIFKISNPDRSKGILLSQGERAEIVWTPMAKPGTKLYVEWHDIKRGRHVVGKVGNQLMIWHDDLDGLYPPQNVITLNVKPGTPNPTPYTPPSTLRPAVPIPWNSQTPKIGLRFGHTLPDNKGDITFFVQMKNGQGLPFWQITPQDAPKVRVGEVRIWEVWNMTMGDHSFHTHGFSFQPIELEYVDMKNPGNNRRVPFPFVEDKDTITIPGRPGGKGTSRTVLRAVIKYDDTGRKGQITAAGKVPNHNPRQPVSQASGGWLVHCHILEHANRGMMTFVQVLP